MTAGFQLIDPARGGAVVIDQSYSNLALRVKGSVLIDGRLDSWYQLRVTVPGTTGVMAYRSVVPHIVRYIEYGADSTVYCFANLRGPAWLDYWLFDEARYGLIYQDTGAKFQVFKPGSTELAFDSRLRYMKSMDTINVNPSPPPTRFTAPDGFQRAYPEWTVPAIIQSNAATYQWVDPPDPTSSGPNRDSFMQGVSGVFPSTSGSVIDFQPEFIWMPTAAPELLEFSGNVSSQQVFCTVVDVANL